MKFKGTIVGQASGSIASLTFSHNRGGQYIRNRSIPTNPSTAQQQAVRNLVGTLTSRWQQTLTSAQRDAWNTYASNVPITDALGEPRNVGGLGMYVRSNTPRMQASIAVVDTAPIIFDLGSGTIPTFTSLVGSTDIATIAFTNTDAWATAVGGYLLLYLSRPQSPAINFFKGPYRFMGKVSGAVSPPTSPATFSAPFNYTATQQAFLQGRFSQTDGRLSAAFRLVATST